MIYRRFFRDALIAAMLLGSVPATVAGTVSVEFYRAIIHVEKHDRDEVEAVASLIDFDRYVESGLSSPTGDMVRKSSTEIEVTHDGDEVRIGSQPQRELIRLLLRVPSRTSLKINVQHYGEIYTSGIEGDIQVEVFKGRVELLDIRGGLLVDVARDGEISIEYGRRKPSRPVVVGIYDGPIRLSLPVEARVEIDAKSHSGRVLDDSVGRPDIDAPSFLLRSVLGDIEIARTRG